MSSTSRPVRVPRKLGASEGCVGVSFIFGMLFGPVRFGNACPAKCKSNRLLGDPTRPSVAVCLQRAITPIGGNEFALPAMVLACCSDSRRYSPTRLVRLTSIIWSRFLVSLRAASICRLRSSFRSPKGVRGYDDKRMPEAMIRTAAQMYPDGKARLPARNVIA